MRDTRMARLAATTAALVALAPALDALGGGLAAQVLIPTRIAGTVVSTTGDRVMGAQIGVIGSASQPASSDDEGKFELNVLGDSMPRLFVRRIGFKPETLQVRLPLPLKPPLEVHLTRVAQMIASVVVKAENSEGNLQLAEVRDRMRTGGNGHFLMREDFEKNNPSKVTDVLRKVPGLMIARGNRGPQFNDIRLRGNRLPPLFWLDGVPLLGVPFDPDQLPPGTIEAVEVYSAASLVPPQFQGPPNSQGGGAIVIWTRQGERRPRRARISADSIARLVDMQRVFIASEVDTPAKIVTIPEPDYPDSLRAAHVGGTATIEFIVDAAGKIDKESIGIVSASHPKLGDSARLAALEASFQPAIRRERPVAQVFHLTVTFTP